MVEEGGQVVIVERRRNIIIVEEGGHMVIVEEGGDIIIVEEEGHMVIVEAVSAHLPLPGRLPVPGRHIVETIAPEDSVDSIGHRLMMSKRSLRHRRSSTSEQQPGYGRWFGGTNTPETDRLLHGNLSPKSNRINDVDNLC